MRNYKQAMEQWIELAEVRGDAGHVTEITKAFEKSGYTGFLRADAKYSESKNDYFGAAGDYAMLGDKHAAFAALEKAFANRVVFYSSRLIRFLIISVPIRALPLCCDGSGCRTESQRPVVKRYTRRTTKIENFSVETKRLSALASKPFLTTAS
jgi:hypothetical protein